VTILVLNAGSSSVKFQLFADEGRKLDVAIRGQVEAINTAPRFIARTPDGRVVGEKSFGAGVKLGHEGAVAYLADFLRAEAKGFELAAVGHRVVHGGPEYARPVRIDRGVVGVLEKFVPLAPLHQPNNLAPISLLLERRPELSQVACFDTSFHATNSEVVQRFAIPGELHAAGVRRYGFHGLSYEYVASALPSRDERAAAGRTVVCHLGSGSSMCALRAGKSIASTMGFTALDGLPMGTRCGALDPGVVLYLMDERKMDARSIEDLLYNESGLLGISGISSDMRVLLDSGEPRARLAVDVFVHRVGRELGSLAAALGGLDALVFTAGIGENSAAIRERICADAAWLGVKLDPDANHARGPRISAKDSGVAVWVIPTNEELMIARHTQHLVASEVGTSH
jgi:acetate kinase